MTPTKTRLWIPGGHGMLGQVVCAKAQARGLTTKATGRDVDVTQAKQVLEFGHAFQPTHIINCAAYTQVDQAETDTRAAWAVNAEGPKSLVALAKRLRCVLLHVSTDYAFDGKSDIPYVEEASTGPKTVYGRSKVAGEEHVLAFAAPHPNVKPPFAAFVVRTSWLFGEAANNFVTTMLRAMQSRETVQVVSDQWGLPTYAGDLADALLDLVGLGQKPQSLPGLYHYANQADGPAITWHAFAEAILKEAQAQHLSLACRRVESVTSDNFIRPAPRPEYSAMDTRKVAEALGAAPPHFLEGLKRMVSHQQMRHQQVKQAG